MKLNKPKTDIKVKKIEKLKLSKEQSGFGIYGDKINKLISAFNEHLEEHEGR